MNAREVIGAALRSTDVDGWESSRPMLHGNGPFGHAYYLGCALCAGDVDTLTDAILTALADAGLIITADADGSEDPSAYALRQAARAFVDGYGIDGPKHLSDVPLWLIARADLIDSFAATPRAAAIEGNRP